MNFLFSNSLDFKLFGMNVSIQYYALCMIAGAVVCYLFCRYFAKKFYDNAALIDNIFIPCFVAGVIGARLWFVVSEFSYYMHNPSKIIAIWEGGLAIQGGVILGAAVGIFMVDRWYLKNKPEGFTRLENIFRWMDIVLPNILIAQCIGRWGNFFNIEVYGSCIAQSKLDWLPNFILKRLTFDEYGYYLCQPGQIVQPLFLYEGILTFLGFILISIVLRFVWKKGRKHGVLGFLYIAYYGLIRAILENLREEEYIMRIFGISQSVMMSIIFIIVGLLGIIYIYRNEIKNLFKRKEVKNG